MRVRARRAASKCLPLPSAETGGGGNLFACKTCGNLGLPRRQDPTLGFRSLGIAAVAGRRLRGEGAEAARGGGGGFGKPGSAKVAGSRAAPLGA